MRGQHRDRLLLRERGVAVCALWRIHSEEPLGSTDCIPVRSIHTPHHTGVPDVVVIPKVLAAQMIIFRRSPGGKGRVRETCVYRRLAIHKSVPTAFCNTVFLPPAMDSSRKPTENCLEGNGIPRKAHAEQAERRNHDTYATDMMGEWMLTAVEKYSESSAPRHGRYGHIGNVGFRSELASF